MEWKRGRGIPRQKFMDWMMEDTDTENSRKRHNIEKSGVVGHFDLPGDRRTEENKSSQ